jgi:cobalt-zinc-cadmium efflux system membrane fusion protein
LTHSIFLATIGVALLCACSERAAETSVAEPSPADPDLIRLDEAALRTAKITLAAAETASLATEFQVSGRVTVNENATARVGSFSEGVVVDCCEQVGAFVKKGQVLARLHSHEVHDAESDHRRAHEQLQSARTDLEYAQQVHQRASRLHELKAGSLQQVQQAETALRRAETAVGMAEAELRRAESHLRYLGFDPPDLEHPEKQASAGSHEAEHETHLLEIRSPISGTILERPVSQGAVVTPSDTLYVISDLSRLWVIAQVPERQLSLVRNGMTVDVAVTAYPGRTFSARVLQVENRLDPETRTVQVRCEIANPRGELKTEMYVSLVLRSPAGTPAVVVPATAVQQTDGEHLVFVPEGDGQFRARRVEAGRQSGSRIEILQGVAEGEQIVVEGSFSLKSELLKSQMSVE